MAGKRKSGGLVNGGSDQINIFEGVKEMNEERGGKKKRVYDSKDEERS